MDTSLFHGNLVNSNLVTTSRILYTPSTFAKTNLIYLQETGFLQAQKTHTSKRENLASYLFFTVVSGSGVLDYEGNHYSLKKGDCVFIDCKKPYSHRTSENLWQLRWVHFYGVNMSHIYEKYTERGGSPCFHPHNLDSFLSLLENIYQVASSDDYVKDMMIYEKLTSLLTLLMKESWHPEKSHRPTGSAKKQSLQELRDYLDANYQNTITLEELSRLFFINKFYLTRVFKEQFGMSIQRYLLQLRITHAKQLLRFTDKSIETIGVECGIGDANYFSRTFKKVEGVSPSHFRSIW